MLDLELCEAAHRELGMKRKDVTPGGTLKANISKILKMLTSILRVTEKTKV